MSAVPPQEEEEEERIEVSTTTKQHPLEHTWTLWFHNPAKKTNASNYFNYLNKVYAVNTVEQFWGLFNHVMAPSKLGIGCTYYMVCLQRDGDTLSIYSHYFTL